MTQSQPESQAPAVDIEVIDLSVPADPAYLSVMRQATAGLGTHLDLTMDEIEDLQVAVDEACALLISGGPGASGSWTAGPAESERSLVTVFTVDHGMLSVQIAGPAAVLPSASFAWTMLHALSRDVSTGQGADGSWISLTCRGRGVTA